MVSTLVGCGGLERTDFNSFYIRIVILKELILRVSTLGVNGDLKELIFNSFYIERCVVVFK